MTQDGTVRVAGRYETPRERRVRGRSARLATRAAMILAGAGYLTLTSLATPAFTGAASFGAAAPAASAAAAFSGAAPSVAAASFTGAAGSAATLPASGQRTGSAFSGTPAVGALFLSSGGHLGHHFCTASVVHSPAGDLLLTAAHCLTGLSLKPPGAVEFAPGYHQGRFPLGLWMVTAKFVSARWASRHDPNDDFAFLVVSGQGRSIERAAGAAETLRTGARLPALVQVIGYPDATSTPIRCSAKASALVSRTLRQLKFVCGGYTDGTSGGPFLLRVNAKTGAGSIIGVIGGYQQGGNTPSISYSAAFGSAIAALYQIATAPAPKPTPTPTPTTAPSTSPTPTPTASPSPTPSP